MFLVIFLALSHLHAVRSVQSHCSTLLGSKSLDVEGRESPIDVNTKVDTLTAMTIRSKRVAIAEESGVKKRKGSHTWQILWPLYVLYSLHAPDLWHEPSYALQYGLE